MSEVGKVSSIMRKIGRTNLERLAILLVLFLAVMLPVVFPIPMPIVVSKPTRGFYDDIQALPAGSKVVFGAHMIAASLAEDVPSVAAIFAHLMKRGINFIIVGYSYSTPPMAQKSLDYAFAATGLKDKYVYGTNYVLIGYIPESDETALVAFIRDFSYFKQDFYGTPIANLPLMQQFKGVDDAKLWINSLGIWWTDVTYRQISPHVKTIYWESAGGASDIFPYYAAGKVDGYLIGIRGAAEYEQLTGIRGRATLFLNAIDLPQLLIIILMVIPNLILLYEKVGKKKR